MLLSPPYHIICQSFYLNILLKPKKKKNCQTRDIYRSNKKISEWFSFFILSTKTLQKELENLNISYKHKNSLQEKKTF